MKNQLSQRQSLATVPVATTAGFSLALALASLALALALLARTGRCHSRRGRRRRRRRRRRRWGRSQEVRDAIALSELLHVRLGLERDLLPRVRAVPTLRPLRRRASRARRLLLRRGLRAAARFGAFASSEGNPPLPAVGVLGALLLLCLGRLDHLYHLRRRARPSRRSRPANRGRRPEGWRRVSAPALAARFVEL